MVRTREASVLLLAASGRPVMMTSPSGATEAISRYGPVDRVRSTGRQSVGDRGQDLGIVSGSAGSGSASGARNPALLMVPPEIRAFELSHPGAAGIQRVRVAAGGALRRRPVLNSVARWEACASWLSSCVFSDTLMAA